MNLPFKVDVREQEKAEATMKFYFAKDGTESYYY